ncbi:MAG: very short patch repair endonuclease [Thermodesulfobacteriota bacterium]
MAKMKTGDPLSPEERSKRMSLVRAKDTKPEMRVRKLVHSMGYRYRLHARNLPGCPDLVFRKRRKVIFIHGCFWHQHDCAMGNRMPKSRIEFWREKLLGNKRRDAQNRQQLKAEGWSVLVIWECQTATTKMDRLRSQIARFLDGQG